MSDYRGNLPIDPEAEVPISDPWDDFELRLAAYLSTMADPEDGDRLLVELPDDGDEEGTAPYAQFAGFDGGQMLRAELSGNHYLAAVHHLSDLHLARLADDGWHGPTEDEPNHVLEEPVARAMELSSCVVRALRVDFGIPDPGLLSFQAWGPAEPGAAILGLRATDDVPADVVDRVVPLPPKPGRAVPVSGRDELRELVRTTLRGLLEEEPVADDDDDFVIAHLGHPVYVRVRHDQPAVEVFARVAHGVDSRRRAALEVGLLNRDHLWTTWLLRGRDVWLRMPVPGQPFAPLHLVTMLELFLEAIAESRADLAYRTGAGVG